MELLLALLTNYSLRAKSVAELSLSNFFQRHWSDIYKCFKGLCFKTKEKIDRLLLQNLIDPTQRLFLFFLDTTPNFKAKSKKADDRTYEVYGNKGIPGYSYSVLTLGKEKSWAIPVKIDRVKSSETKTEKGLTQFLDTLKNLPEKALKVLAADSLYSSNKFLSEISKQKDAIVITRARGNRKAFHKFTGTQKGKGRGRKYGDKVDENNFSNEKIVEEKTLSGKLQYVEMITYNNVILRGCKNIKMYDYPVNLIKVQVRKENKELKYDRALVLLVAGEKRDNIDAVEAFNYYRQRFDIEFFFKFGKTYLLMDKLQTTSSSKDDTWHYICGIIFNLLYAAKNQIKEVPKRPWDKKPIDLKKATPFQVFRSMPKFLISLDLKELIAPVIKRGHGIIKRIRKIFRKKTDQEVIQKIKPAKTVEIAIKSTFGKRIIFTKTQINNVDKNTKITKTELLEKLEPRFEKLGIPIVDTS